MRTSDTAERLTWSKVGIGSRADTGSPLSADKISLFLLANNKGSRVETEAYS